MFLPSLLLALLCGFHAMSRPDLSSAATRSLVPGNAMRGSSTISSFLLPVACTSDADCDDPLRCCQGRFFDFCCDVGGLGALLPRRNGSVPRLVPA